MHITTKYVINVIYDIGCKINLAKIKKIRLLLGQKGYYFEKTKHLTSLYISFPEVLERLAHSKSSDSFHLSEPVLSSLQVDNRAITLT